MLEALIALVVGGGMVAMAWTFLVSFINSERTANEKRARFELALAELESQSYEIAYQDDEPEEIF